MHAGFQRLAFGMVSAVVFCLSFADIADVGFWWMLGLLLFPTIYGLILLIEFIVLGLSTTPVGVRSGRLRSLITAWWLEFLAGVWTFGWNQPFRSNRYKDSIANPSEFERGLIFVHGFVCNRGIWNGWLENCGKRGTSFIAINLGSPFATIDAYKPALNGAVARMSEATQLAPVIVAHSMGGLAVRAWLADQPGHQPPRVHQVVTVATPHSGTWLARFSAARNAKQMKIGSPWLRALEERETPAALARFVCFWSDCDNIVLPSAHARLNGAENRFLPGTPHVAMVNHPDIRAAVFGMLGVEDART